MGITIIKYKFKEFSTMRHIAAFMLLRLSGNKSPSEEDIKNLLKTIGGECDLENMKRLFSGLEGKNIDDLIEQGRKKLVFNQSQNSSELVSEKKENSISKQVDLEKEKDESS